MRRWLGLVVAAAALTYFFDPVNGRERRERARLWLVQLRERALGAGDATPAERRDAADAVANLEQAMAAAAAAAPSPEAVAHVPEPEHSVAGTAGPAATTVTDLREPPTSALDDWELTPPPSSIPDEQGSTSSRPILAAAATAAIAAVAVAIGLIAWAVWPSSESGLTTQTEALMQDQAQAIALLSQPKVKRVPVLGARGRLVLVFAPNGKAVLIASQVVEAPSGKTYEAWVIVGNKPVPAGLFGGGGASTVVPLNHPVPKGAVVAVTLEPAEGVSSPTQKPLYATKRA